MEKEKEIEISVDRILKLIWKNIIILIAAALVCAVGAYLFTRYTVDDTYASEIGFTIVSTASDTNVANPSYLNSNLSYTRSIVRSKVEMLRTNDYYKMVAAQLNSDIDDLIAAHPDKADFLSLSKKNAAQIGASVSFSIIEETELFTIRVVTNSKGESKMIADAIKKTANARLTQLALPDNALEGETTVTDTVRCYKTPLTGVLVGPNLRNITLIGFVLGFVIALAVIIVIDMMDNRVKCITDLEEHYDKIPILGRVASFKTTQK